MKKKNKEKVKNLKRNFFYLILIFCYSACGNDDVVELGLEAEEEDYIVFGHFYGECGGEGCIETYALTNDKIFEDTNDKYKGTDFEFVELEKEIFEKVKDLTDKFPNQLLSETVETFGCPDCGDWGGILVQFVQKDETQTWFIDIKTEDVPEYLNDFTKLIREKISIINE